MSQSSEQPKIDDLKRLLRRLEQVAPDKEIVVRPSLALTPTREEAQAAASQGTAAAPAPALSELGSLVAKNGPSSENNAKATPPRVSPPPLPLQQHVPAIATLPATQTSSPRSTSSKAPLVFALAGLLSVLAAAGLWSVRDRFVVSPASAPVAVPAVQVVTTRSVVTEKAAEKAPERTDVAASRPTQATAQSIVAASPAPAPPPPAALRADEPRLVAAPQPATPPASVTATPQPAQAAPAQAPANGDDPKAPALGESSAMRAQPAQSGRDKFDSEARLEAYLERGQKLVEEGDLTAARAFFRRAAESGDPRGALALGMTYDVNYFAQLGIRGVPADSAAAGEWYRKAMDLGSKEALDRLERLPQQ